MDTSIQQISQIMPGALQRASEIVPYSLEKLTPSEMAVVKASVPNECSPRVSELDALQLVKFSSAIRKNINLRLGLKIEKGQEEDEEDIIAGISFAIQKHRNLTTKEIERAVDKALDGDFLSDGQTFVYFNLANFSLWIKAYINTKLPVIKKHAQLLHQLPQAPIPKMSEEEIIKSRCEIANMYLDSRKANPLYKIPGGATLYDGLDELGIIKLSLDRKKELYRNAKLLNPAANDEVWKIEAKELAYNQFINDMLQNGFRLDEVGELVADPEPVEEE